MEQWHSGKTVEPEAYLLCLPFLKIEEVQRLKKHHEHISLTQVHQLSTQVDALTRVEVSSTVYKNVLMLYCLSGLLCASSFCHPPSSCFFLRLLLSAPPELMHSLLLVSLYLYRSSTFPPTPPPLFFYQNTLTFYFLCCHVSTNLPLINYQQMFTAHIHHTHIICTHNKHICCSVCHSPLHCFADSAPEYTVCTLSDNICFMGCHLTLSVDRADDTLYRTTRLWPIV